MKSKTKTVFKIISTTIVTMAVILAFLLVGVRIFGFEIYTVLSGSMEPTYHVGSLVYVKKTDSDELKVGDTITFKLTENTIATHRIKEIIKEENTIYYRTKGDANEIEDKKLTSYNDVIGKVEFSIPLLGFLSSFIQRPPGSYITIVIGILLIIFVFVIDSKTEDNKNKKAKKKEVKNEEKDNDNNS